MTTLLLPPADNTHSADVQVFRPEATLPAHDVAATATSSVFGTTTVLASPTSSGKHIPGWSPAWRVVSIDHLPKRRLLRPLSAVLEEDGEGFLARSVDLPLYGYGDDPIRAIDALKGQLEALYDELHEDDEFTEEWLEYREWLRTVIE